MTRRPKLKQIERQDFDARQAGSKCGSCPYHAHGARPVKPRGGTGKLLVILDQPSKYDDRHGCLKSSTPQRLLERSLAESNSAEVYQTWATLCRAPEGITKDDTEAAIQACRPRLEREIEQARERCNPGESVWSLALGPLSFRATTDKLGSSDPWLGSPVEGLAAGKVVPTWDPGYILSPKGSRYAAVWQRHIERAALLSDGRLGAFEWPEEVVDEGPRLSEVLEQISNHAEAGGEVSVDIETRGLDLDSEISCVGFSTDVGSCCVQLPLAGQYNRLVRDILAGGIMVGQNISFDRTHLRHHGYALTPHYECTMLAASILDPQLPKNLAALVSTEFHSEAWKASYRTNTETGIMLGEWNSTDPAIERERRVYCQRDSYMTFLLWQRQKERLSAY